MPPRHHNHQTGIQPADTLPPSVPNLYPHVVTLNAPEQPSSPPRRRSLQQRPEWPIADPARPAFSTFCLHGNLVLPKLHELHAGLVFVVLQLDGRYRTKLGAGLLLWKCAST